MSAFDDEGAISAKKADHQAEIPAAIEDLGNRAEALHKLIEQLGRRLGPVMRPVSGDPVLPTDAVPPMGGPAVPLVGTLGVVGEALEECRVALVEIRERLEV